MSNLLAAVFGVPPSQAARDRAYLSIVGDLDEMRAFERILGEHFPEGIAWQRVVIPDERPQIEAALRQMCDVEHCDLVVTTGGTGPAPRDVTPEATRAVLERELPGFVG